MHWCKSKNLANNDYGENVVILGELFTLSWRRMAKSCCEKRKPSPPHHPFCTISYSLTNSPFFPFVGGAESLRPPFVCTTRQPPPTNPPTLQEAVIMIASLGGFMGRKGDGYPGTTTVWRGLQRLEGIAVGFAVGFALAGSMQNERDGP